MIVLYLLASLKSLFQSGKCKLVNPLTGCKTPPQGRMDPYFIMYEIELLQMDADFVFVQDDVHVEIYTNLATSFDVSSTRTFGM